MSIMAQSLEDMAEELTCPICLCHFTTPVSTPCGHNFCSECLELTWKDENKEYSCPQCRCTFDRKPDLMKNTLLSNLVSKVMEAKAVSESKEDVIVEEVVDEKRVEEEIVLCDHCMKLEADKTCLTCMASFCYEHLQPHMEIPSYRDHQLRKPLADLHMRKCMDHGKILDYHCWSHYKSICCYCLADHKQCRTDSLQDSKSKKELEIKQLLRTLTEKIAKVSNVSDGVKSAEKKVMDTTKRKKDLLEGEFDEIKDLIQLEQRKAMNKIEEEEKKVKNKFIFTYNVLSKKQRELETFKAKVESLLQQDDDLEFLKRAEKLQDTTSKDPFKPNIEFDENLLQQIYRNTVSLKEILKNKVEHPGEIPEQNCPPLVPREPRGRESEFKKREIPEKNRPPSVPREPQSREGEFKQHEFAERKYVPLVPKKPEHEKTPRKPRNKKTPAAAAAAASAAVAATASATAQVEAVVKTSPGPVIPTREELLRYAVRLQVDINTVHKRVLLSNQNTKLTISDRPQDYPDNPQRFVHCSQALCSTGFSNGLHYWEIELQGGNFSGLGVAYGSIARTGGESRLGRSKASWCIEWFNGKLQAWHNDKQTDLPVHNTSKIGVLLNCNEGFVTFFSVAKKFCQIYRFKAKFTEIVYPAFWVFSSTTTLSISSLY
ncbi:E3 ubiquitin/ISG15 ligase TRIM25 [Pelobates fuscus]|uniref:E3 ubiquitin/ISG15 ligase TRIM25 n=1 Tax=Pelobates fuscus TaxID=191477 RepID=UPI002FE471EE